MIQGIDWSFYFRTSSDFHRLRPGKRGREKSKKRPEKNGNKKRRKGVKNTNGRANERSNKKKVRAVKITPRNIQAQAVKNFFNTLDIL